MLDFTKLKNCLDKFVEKYNTPGVDCIVYKEHKMIFRHFAGVSDIENNKMMNGQELYLIFSMTKMLTCVSALQLFEQGKFLLSDNVSSFLPEFSKMRISSKNINAENADVAQDGYAKNPITIKDLFTMSAGLDYVLDDEPITKALREGRTSTRELVGAMSEKILCFEPGTRFRYSLCHDVLGALIEVISGQKLGEYMKDNIFSKLGMNNTFFGVPKDEERLSKMAARYTYDENRKPVRLPLECTFNISDEYESGGAGLTSCIEDYALFLDAISCGGIGKTGNRILSPATVELMATNHLKGTPLDDFNRLRCGYGYGLGVRTHIDKTQSGSLSPIGEFGWDGSAGSFSMVDTKNKISLTYFQHIHKWDIRLQRELRNSLYACLE